MVVDSTPAAVICITTVTIVSSPAVAVIRISVKSIAIVRVTIIASPIISGVTPAPG
jgi:hypothetical protein